MFAGPNGSGKSTVKNGLQRSGEWFGVYINPDELEKTIRETGQLSFEPFELSIRTEEIQHSFATSSFLKSQQLEAASDQIEARAGTLFLATFR